MDWLFLQRAFVLSYREGGCGGRGGWPKLGIKPRGRRGSKVWECHEKSNIIVAIEEFTVGGLPKLLKTISKFCCTGLLCNRKLLYSGAIKLVSTQNLVCILLHLAHFLKFNVFNVKCLQISLEKYTMSGAGPQRIKIRFHNISGLYHTSCYSGVIIENV